MSDLLPRFDPVVIPPEDEALREPVRRFIAREVMGLPPEVRAQTWLGADNAFSRKLAGQGWLGLTFPRRYGGAARSNFARFVLNEELLAAGAPVSAHWTADRQTGPLLMKFGTEAQREYFLPRIVRGEAFFAIGLSEPDTGSDLASVRTRAIRTDRGWVLDGRKIWTSLADTADYCCALVRTSGTTEDRHKGLSQFIFDLKLPGIQIQPIRDLCGGGHFNEVLFDQVELPADALVGEEGDGWQQVTAELAFERSGPERIYSSLVLVDTWLNALRRHAPPDTAVLAALGRIAARTSTLRALSLSVAAQLERGEQPVLAASFVKELGTVFEQQVAPWIEDAMSVPAIADALAPMLERTLAYIQLMQPTFSIRGGTREIMRGMIARGLGLR